MSRMWTEDQNSKRKRKDRSSLSKVSYHIRKEELKCLGISLSTNQRWNSANSMSITDTIVVCAEKLKRTLWKSFGQITLSYDMVFCIDDLNQSLWIRNNKEYEAMCHTSIAKNMRKEVNNITDYVAHMNILLTYYKCKDDWNDDRKLEKLVLEKIYTIKVGFPEIFYREK